MGLLQTILDILNRRRPGPGPGPPPVPVPPPVTPSGLVAALNAQRAARGLAPLVENTALNQLSASWARSMASSGVLTHGAFFARIAAVFPDVAASENVAEGQRDVAEVVQSWMLSPGHRANILGNYNAVGTGSAPGANGRLFWCVDFAKI